MLQAVLAMAALIAIAPMARAQLPILYLVGSAGPFTVNSDSVTINSFNGSATLFPGVGQSLQVNTETFNVMPGVLSSANFNANRLLVINATAGTFVQNVNIADNALSGTATFSGGATTTFNLGGGNLVDVTPLPTSVTQNPGATINPLFAVFLLHSASPVPEPGSIALLAGLGITGLGFFVRRRK